MRFYVRKLVHDRDHTAALRQCRADRVHVAVNQARQHSLPLQIDLLCIWARLSTGDLGVADI